MKRVYVLLIVISGISPALLALAQTASSPGYQGRDMGTVPATVQASSTNYLLNGSIQSFVGEVLISPNYQGGAGGPLPQITTTTPPTPPTGQTGGVPYNPPPTDGLGRPVAGVNSPSIKHRIWTYLPVGYLSGERGDAGAQVYVNGSSDAISYPNEFLWVKSAHPLGLGNNLLLVRARTSLGFSSSTQSVMRRRLVGDVDDSQYVDDVDLSLFSRAWNKPIPEADFNEDGRVDDYDLSLLVSHWNQSF